VVLLLLSCLVIQLTMLMCLLCHGSSTHVIMRQRTQAVYSINVQGVHTHGAIGEHHVFLHSCVEQTTPNFKDLKMTQSLLITPKMSTDAASTTTAAARISSAMDVAALSAGAAAQYLYNSQSLLFFVQFEGWLSHDGTQESCSSNCCSKAHI
jgi:hypothetical protein